MTDHKYLSDGRKVALVGKLNNEEWIVQEVFVTEAGDEIPSGERFTAKSLHDAPVESWKDRDVRKKEQRIKELEANYDRIQSNLKQAKLDDQVRSDIKRSLKSLASKMSGDSFEVLEKFLCGEINWLVKDGYSLELPQPFDKAVLSADNWSGARRYEGLKLISLFGKSNGDLCYRLHQYGDSSGGSCEIRPFETFESASRHCIQTAVTRASESKLGWSEVQNLLNSESAQYITNREREILLDVLHRRLRAATDERDQYIQSAAKSRDKEIAGIEAALEKAQRQ